MFSVTLFLLPFFFTAVQAANDWSKPCVRGECSYDLPATKGVSGTMRLWGSSDAISDITAAAGWIILGCDNDALAQDIRLVCDSEHANSAHCSHLYRSVGAVGKIVRLPESCGKNAFARVSKAWVHKDQSLPPDIAKRFKRRDGSAPEVQGLSLDTNFDAIDTSKAGEVKIAIQGANVRNQNRSLTINPARRSSRIHQRGLLSFIESAFKSFNSFDKTVTKDLAPIDINKDFPILDQNLSCSGFSASVKADAVAKAHAVISIGAAAAGTIVPPNLSEFGLFIGMNATFDGTLNLAGSASGTADSGLIDLFSVGIPGLDFPGVLTVGPTFKIQGRATASLNLAMNTTVDLSYTIQNAKLFFPSSANHQSGLTFNPGNSPLKLSVDPKASAGTGTITAHVIPRVDLGISGMNGLAKATVFLNLDASATTTFNVTGETSTEVSTSDSDNNGITTAVNGCADVDAEFDVNAGADGSFFGVFNQSASVALFSKKISIFQKCLGTGGQTRKRHHARKPIDKAVYARDFSCPAGIGSLVTFPTN